MNDKHGAKYAFYYLLSLVSLIFVGISVGMVAFGIIDKTIFDPLAYNSYGNNYDGGLKFAISALFIAAPVYYLSLFFIKGGLKKGELEKDSAIRRWLTYFIILVSALVILGVFIGVINNFLSGELSSRFIFKALAMLVISGLTFSYYFHDIKRDVLVGKNKTAKIFFITSLVVVLAAFISAWFFVESPRDARMRRLDQMVVNNMNSLESAINSFYADKGYLPETIDEIRGGNYYADPSSFKDPESGMPIEYKKIGDKEFELCADFRLPSADPGNKLAMPANDIHEAGRDCLKGDLWATTKAEEIKANL